MPWLAAVLKLLQETLEITQDLVDKVRPAAVWRVPPPSIYITAQRNMDIWYRTLGPEYDFWVIKPHTCMPSWGQEILSLISAVQIRVLPLSLL